MKLDIMCYPIDLTVKTRCYPRVGCHCCNSTLLRPSSLAKMSETSRPYDPRVLAQKLLRLPHKTLTAGFENKAYRGLMIKMEFCQLLIHSTEKTL